jgi:hypothetical protein
MASTRRWQALIRRALDNVLALDEEHRIDQYEEPFGALLGHGREGGVNVIDFGCLDHLNVCSERTGSGLCLL